LPWGEGFGIPNVLLIPWYDGWAEIISFREEEEESEVVMTITK